MKNESKDNEKSKNIWKWLGGILLFMVILGSVVNNEKPIVNTTKVSPKNIPKNNASTPQVKPNTYSICKNALLASREKVKLEDYKNWDNDKTLESYYFKQVNNSIIAVAGHGLRGAVAFMCSIDYDNKIVKVEYTSHLKFRNNDKTKFSFYDEFSLGIFHLDEMNESKKHEPQTPEEKKEAKRQEAWEERLRKIKLEKLNKNKNN